MHLIWAKISCLQVSRVSSHIFLYIAGNFHHEKMRRNPIFTPKKCKCPKYAIFSKNLFGQVYLYNSVETEVFFRQMPCRWLLLPSPGWLSCPHSSPGSPLHQMGIAPLPRIRPGSHKHKAPLQFYMLSRDQRGMAVTWNFFIQGSHSHLITHFKLFS